MTKLQTPDIKEPIAGGKVKHPANLSAKEKQRGRDGAGGKSSVQCQQMNQV